jgi:hypothetical protein
MKGKRTGLDFSEHKLIITKTDEVLIHYLKKPNTTWDSIKFINTNGIMAVTGDYGNWIFCREFHPSADGYVSDGYWHEKLQISSTQDATEFDGEATREALIQKIKEYKEEKIEELEDGEEIEEDEEDEILEYYKGCLERCDEILFDYEIFAYREQPNRLDYDDVILIKDYKPWLKCIFDGFEEICRRMKEEEKEGEK